MGLFPPSSGKGNKVLGALQDCLLLLLRWPEPLAGYLPRAGESVTRTGKKLELRLRKTYFGLERGFPGSSGLGKPNGGGQGETPSRGQEGENPRGAREDRGTQA